MTTTVAGCPNRRAGSRRANHRTAAGRSHRGAGRHHCACSGGHVTIGEPTVGPRRGATVRNGFERQPHHEPADRLSSMTRWSIARGPQTRALSSRNWWPASSRLSMPPPLRTTICPCHGSRWGTHPRSNPSTTTCTSIFRNSLAATRPRPARQPLAAPGAYGMAHGRQHRLAATAVARCTPWPTSEPQDPPRCV